MNSFRLLCCLVIVGIFCFLESAASQKEGVAPARPSALVAANASIEGRVVNAQTGRALKMYMCNFVDETRLATASSGRGDDLSVSSASVGQFSIEASPALSTGRPKGRITLFPSRDENGAMNDRISFESGENMTGFVLRMTPKAVIGTSIGRVRRANGWSIRPASLRSRHGLWR